MCEGLYRRRKNKIKKSKIVKAKGYRTSGKGNRRSIGTIKLLKIGQSMAMRESGRLMFLKQYLFVITIFISGCYLRELSLQNSSAVSEEVVPELPGTTLIIADIITGYKLFL